MSLVRWPVILGFASVTTAAAVVLFSRGHETQPLLNLLTAFLATIAAIVTTGPWVLGTLSAAQRLPWRVIQALFVLSALGEACDLSGNAAFYAPIDSIMNVLLLTQAPIALWFSSKLEPMRVGLYLCLLTGFALLAGAVSLRLLFGFAIIDFDIDRSSIGAYADFAQLLCAQAYLLWALLVVVDLNSPADHGPRENEEAANTGFGTSRISSPLIWAVLEGRGGDDHQVLALAHALGEQIRIVRLTDHIAQVVIGRMLDSLGFALSWHRDYISSECFPDLLIAAGGRAVSLARGVKRASGNSTKLIFLGRPFAPLGEFDLIVTTPQYGLPASSNVQPNLLPLNHVSDERLQAAAGEWRKQFDPWPRPWIGVLVGGNSGSFRMGDTDTDRLIARLNALVQETNGSILLVTSARTPAMQARRLAEAVAGLGFCHIWTPGEPRNPYVGILSLADRFLVTSESASMIAEAINTGRHVELFDLEQRVSSRLTTACWREIGRFGPLTSEVARSGLCMPPRDLRKLHDALVTTGYIGASGTAVNAIRSKPIDRDLNLTVARIRELLATSTSHASAQHGIRPRIAGHGT